jgi:hypothetical protein
VIQADQDPSVLRCRARVSEECEAGRRRRNWRDDGTYQRSDDSVCCTACYVLLGVPERRYVNAAIQRYWAGEVLRHGPPVDPTP